MAERITGITTQDINGARKAAFAAQREHSTQAAKALHGDPIYSTSQERQQAKFQANQLAVRSHILDFLVGQSKQLPEQNGWKPHFHPDVLSDKLDHAIDRGDITPVLVPLPSQSAGSENTSVPLYIVNASLQRVPQVDVYDDKMNLMPKRIIHQLAQQGDPEHTPLNKVVQATQDLGKEVVESFGMDPETTEVRPITLHDWRALTKTGILNRREQFVTADTSYADGHLMTTGVGYELGGHSPDQNTKPTKLVIAKKLQAPTR